MCSALPSGNAELPSVAGDGLHRQKSHHVIVNSKPEGEMLTPKNATYLHPWQPDPDASSSACCVSQLALATSSHD